MVNSSHSRTPILLDTPEGATANTNPVIEINESGGNSQNLSRRRRHDSTDDIVVTDSSKRARVEVPVIDLTSDTEEEYAMPDNYDTAERLVRSFREQVHNSTRRLAELRARREHVMSLLPDEAQRRIRRAMSLRDRSSLNHPRHQSDDQRADTRTESTRNQPPINVYDDAGLPPILVDDDEGHSHSSLFNNAGDIPRASCSRANATRVFMPDNMNSRPTFPTSLRSERTRPLTHHNLHSQETELEFEIPSISHFRDTFHPMRTSRARHNQRRRQQLRDCLAYLSPLSRSASAQPPNSDESLASSMQSAEYQAGSATIDQTLPNIIPEIDGNRLTRRLYPLDQPLQPYMPDLLPAVVRSIWGTESRLHHLGFPEEEHEDYEVLWNLTERLGQVKPKGLSKTEMEEIPSFRYTAASKGSSNGCCVVCMMNYTNKEKLRRLPCNHDFHSKCIDRWLKNNRSCPVCRKDVTLKKECIV